MSRNKENNPLSALHRPSIASVTRNLPSDDFFTDSLLENSFIPSPSPRKDNPARPRRAVGIARALQNAKESSNNLNRQSPAENGLQASDRQLTAASNMPRKKSRSPLRTNGLSTPPRSRSLTTPPEFSSPPGGMTDVYQRIADEEDLAATEREVDSEGEDLENGPQDTFGEDLDIPMAAEGQDEVQVPEPRSTNTFDPLHMTADDEKENRRSETAGALSGPSTLDFIQNEMTDRALAAKLTPHVLNRAKDRARLEKLKHSRIPIDFKNSPKVKSNGLNASASQRPSLANLSKGPIIFENASNAERHEPQKTSSTSSTASTPQQKLKAFSRATRPGLNQKEPLYDPDGDIQPEVNKREKVVAFSRASRVLQDPGFQEHSRPAQPHSSAQMKAFSRADRPNHYLRAHSEEPELPGGGVKDDTQTSVLSEPLPGSTPKSQKKQPSTSSFLAKWRQQTAERRSEKTDSTTGGDASPVDWAAAAADVALPSIEGSSTPRDTPPRLAIPSSIQKQRSIDRIRKWENDFTGLSFQISDSPPIRSRPLLNDSTREREIETLAKQAVTTNRLEEIQEKDPNVLVRKSSRSFSPEERRQTLFKPEAEADSRTDQAKNLVPESDSHAKLPVPIHRSSSGSTTKSTPSPNITSASHDSLEQLQRLARAVSTTPKLSPATQQRTTSEDQRAVHNSTSATDPLHTEAAELPPTESRTPGLRDLSAHQGAETPRVIGAWTDTILPDTVKTVRQQRQASKYAETPHVNAGGWIDTPLPSGKRMQHVPIPMTIEEATEELTNGINPAAETGAKDRGPTPAQDFPPEKSGHDATNGNSASHAEELIPTSALANVLNEAKQKRIASKETKDFRDDTLNLGDATIQSFEDLITNAADITADLTSFIRAGAEDEFLKQRYLKSESEGETNNSEVVFIGHLTSRMERLMSNLHEARKGISRLEQKVSSSAEPDSQKAITTTNSEGSRLPCNICGGRATGHVHTYAKSDSWIPMAYSVFTLPIPLLFYPRRKDERRLLPRPTWLGFFTITIWMWYIVECMMCEIYSRPLYAERYVWPLEPEPEFPFVLPTMIFRWTRFDQVAPGIWRTLVALYRIIGMLLGLTDGFVDDAKPGNSYTSVALPGAAQATKAAWNLAKNFLPGAANQNDGANYNVMNDEFV